MTPAPAGNGWLKNNFKLSDYSFTHSSYIGNNPSMEITTKGNIEQIYGPGYAVKEDTPLAHLEFALKYDDLNLDFLKTVFSKIDQKQISDYIDQTPSGRYARKIGFLYEFLTGQELSLQNTIRGNYVDLLDPEKYITGTIAKNTKWRINDNLLGTAAYCPIVRKTRNLETLLKKNIKESIEALKKEYPESIFSRAIQYLYKKETKSSFEIEKEEPTEGRMERFVALLAKAGAQPIEEVLQAESLVRLQNIIVDPRFTANDFRDFQNYVGESLPNGQTLVHYICPPPTNLKDMMDGLRRTAAKTNGVDAGVRAAVIAFGFVFIHPFEDGNGRLHRFLIHDILVHDGIVSQGLIIPVSAHMLNHIRDYDHILESYSKPLMQKINYQLNEQGEITITQPGKVEGYFRYPDLTAQSVYLIETIHATLQQDMPEELLFLLRYDEAKHALQNIVDMPDKEINRMLLFLHQNHGYFPKRRRKEFEKLTGEEIQQMQDAYRTIFEVA
jgi:Fic family protein